MRVRTRSVAGALLFLLASLHALAAADLRLTPSFDPADPARSWVDVGGTWDGSAEVSATTGDGFGITVFNAPGAVPDPLADTAYDLQLSVTLPVGFLYVDGTVAGPAGTSASQAGTLLTITLPPDTDLAPGESLDVSFGLTTDTNLVAGVKNLLYEIIYGTTDGASDATADTTQVVQAFAGDSTIAKDPAEQSRAINETATWDVTVTNTGFGGLFDVVVDESLINPNPAGSLQVSSMTQTAPPAPVASGALPTLTLPYLAPGESFVVGVEATVLGCLNINNRAQTDDRTGETAATANAQVLLDLEQPLIAFSPPDVSLSYDGSSSSSFFVDNTGLGPALGVSILTNLQTLPVTVTPLGSDWSYDAGTGVFTLLRDGGTLANGASVELAYLVEPADVCSGGINETVIWDSRYTNACGNPYEIPFELSSISGPGDGPSISLSKSVPDSRLQVGEASTWTLSLGAANRNFIATDPLEVIDVLPAGVTGVVVGAAPAGTSTSCTGSCEGGDTLTWTVPLDALVGTLELTIDFVAPSDPCEAGNFLENTASLSALSTASCSLDASDGATSLLGSNPEAGVDQAFDVGSSPNGAWETGAPDDGDGVREQGEGEFIPFSAAYSFGPAYPGEWAGSTYVDDFSFLAGQTLVPGTLTVDIAGSGPAAVPPASIVSGVGTLEVDLGFMADPAFTGSPDVAGIDFVIAYQTTSPDADLPLPGDVRNIVQRSTLTVTNGGGPGSCATNGNTFVEGAFLTLERANVATGVSMPQQIEICGIFPTTISVDNARRELASNVLTTFRTDADYAYVTGQTPVYGGVFDATNQLYSENGGVDPTWELLPAQGDLTGQGTIQVQIQRRAATGMGASPASSRVDFDDEETSPSLPRDFSVGGSGSPGFVLEGKLSLTVTPQEYAVTADRARWRIYVTNGGAGTAYGATLEDVVPAGLLPDEAETNAENPGFPVSIAGQTMTWDLGDIPPGETRIVGVVADVEGSTCSIPPGSNSITARWGCGGVDHQVVTATDPDITFPDGQLQASHIVAESKATLCANDSLTIAVRNTGRPHVYDVGVTEDLRTATTGLAFVPGSVEYSVNGGMSWTPGGDPVGDPLVWTSFQIPPLADIAPQSEVGGVDEVRIRFEVAADERANGADTGVVADASGNLSCGAVVSAPTDAFSVTVDKPEIRVQKTGRNLTAGQALFSESLYAATGDDVEYRVRIINEGEGVAGNVRLRDVFPPTGGSGRSITFPDTSVVAIVDGIPLSIQDLPANTTHDYFITESLGATCVDDVNYGAVSWGCVDNGPSTASNLTGPIDGDDTADIVMLPAYDPDSMSQGFTSLPGGRVEVTLSATNLGGPAAQVVITDTLPSGYVADASFTPLVGGDADVTSFTPDLGTPAVPSFTVVGTIDNGETVTVTFRALPTSGLDVTADPFVNPETTGNGLDPAAPAAGPNLFEISASSTCGDLIPASDSETLDPDTPDVDIAIDPARLVVFDGESALFTVTLENAGELASVADGIRFLFNLGTAWTNAVVTVTSPGSGGTGGSCDVGLGECTAAQLGSLAAGATATITIAADANDNGGSLALETRVLGELLDDSGAATGSNYSFDRAQPRVVGFQTSKTLDATSEAITSGSDLTIGEEPAWILSGRWFGGEPVSSIVVRDHVPAGLGYLSATTTANHTVTSSITAEPALLDPGRVEFSVDDLATGEGTFEYRLLARALNETDNVQGRALVNNLGFSFSSFATTFASDAAADGFGGDESELHAEDALSIAIPAIAVDKEVRNVTQGGGFADSGSGDAGDVFEYRVTLSNTGDAPLMDVTLSDTLGSAKLSMQDGASDGVDNDGDGSIDEALEGLYVTGGGGSVSFDDANTALPAGSPSRTLARLDAGQSLVFLYRVDALSSVVPSEVLPNGASGAGSTLPGSTGSQSAPTGTPGSPTGERILSDSDQADVTVVDVDLAKIVFTTSVGADADPDVLIGEQVQFELRIILPEGTVPNFVVNDNLPLGLSLLQTPAVTIGSAISGGQPTITPSILPASGDPLAITWDFGTRMVSSGTEAERTVVIPYLTQVRNVSTNQESTELVNEASYSFDGSPTNLAPVTLTIREGDVSVVKNARNVTRGDAFSAAPTRPDAGDRIEYRVRLQNGGSVSAHDLTVTDALPEGLAYEAGSTSGAFGVDPDITGSGAPGDPQTLTWGLGQAVPANLDVAGGATEDLFYTVVALEGVEPDQLLTNDAGTTWTSLDGAPGPDLGVGMGAPGAENGERTGQDGSGGLNDLAASGQLSFRSRDTATLSKSLADGVLGGPDFRIGELLTFTLTAADLPEGTIDAFVVGDTLPANTAFVRTVSVGSDGDGSPWDAGAPFTHTNLVDGTSAPAPGATGAILWDFGTLVNAGDNASANDSLAIVYEVRVTSDIPDAASTTLQNAATLDHELADGSAATRREDTVVFDALQPLLSFDKSVVSAPDPLGIGDTIRYRLVATNDGDAPAYDVVVRDFIPEELRDTALAGFSYTINGSAPTTPPTYDGSNLATSGEVTWTWPSSEPLDPSGATLVIEFDAVVDADVGPGIDITNAARIDEWHSLPSDDPEAAERKSYGPTANDEETLTTESADQMTKTGVSGLPIGATITYTVTFPETPINVVHYDIALDDLLPGGLELLSIAEGPGNGATGYDDSASDIPANTVAVVFDTIPANAQMIVSIEARVRNVAANQAGVDIVNTAQLTYARSDGAASEPPLSDDHTLNLLEPDPTLTKLVRNVTRGDTFGVLTQPDAGDVLEYRVTLGNANGADVSDAYDIAFVDALEVGLAYVTGSTAGDIAVDPDTSGSGGSGDPQTLTWGRTQALPLDLDLPVADSLVFTYQVLVLEPTQPRQSLDNAVRADWTSIDGPGPNVAGDPDGERTGGGSGPNDYDAGPVTAAANARDEYLLSKVRSDDTYGPGDDDLRIGDVATFSLTITLQEGLTRAVSVRDQLPAGLALVRTVSIGGDTAAPYSAAPPFSYADIPASSTPDASVAGVSGATLTWDLGDLTNTDTDNASSEQLVIVYEVRALKDTIALAPSTTLTNDARLSYVVADGSPGTPRDDATGVDVLQPVLSISKAIVSTPSPIEAGALIGYEITVTNSGLAPAYNVLVSDTLPEELRDTPPSAISHLVGGAAPIATPLFDASQQAVSGRVTWTLQDADSIAPGETWVITYSATIDADVGTDVTITNLATLEEHFSLAGDDPNAAERQRYATGLTDSTTLTTFDPPTELTKSGPAQARIGETVFYTITMPGTVVQSTIADVVITDDLPANLELIAVSEDPSSAGVGFDASLSDPGTNHVEASFTSIPAGEQGAIRVEARVRADQSANQSGVDVVNTASATFSDVPGGTTLGPLTDDHTVRLTEPSVTTAKTGRNVTLGDAFGTISAPDAGDLLEYRVIVSNAAGSDVSEAFDLEVRDTIPADVTFVGMTSATLGGADITPLDPAGAPEGPLAWGRGAGQDLDLDPGEDLVLVYQVRVEDGVRPGTTLDNLVVADWTSLDGPNGFERDGDGGSGGLDDYVSAPVGTSTTSPDPAALLKAAASGPLPGGELRVGDVVIYTLTLSDLPEGTSAALLVRDTLPANMEFVETRQLHTDADGSPFVAAPPFTYADLVEGVNAPAAGSTGTLAWDFGDLVNAGDNVTTNDDLVIVYAARVKATLPAADTTTLTNAATLDYQVASGPAAQRQASDDSTVLQPRLAITKETVVVPSPIEPGAVVTYRITVDNLGLAPAYNVLVKDTLPEEMRDTALAGFVYTIGGAPPATPPTYDGSARATSGEVFWDWPDSEPLDPGASLTITFDATIDADVAPNTLIVNEALVDDYFSLDSSTPENVAERKSYGNVGPAMVSLTSFDPPGTLDKSGPPAALVGESITFTLAFPGETIDSELFDVTLVDDLPDDLALVSVAPAPGNGGAGFDASATDPGTNHVEVSFTNIPIGQQALVEVVARVRADDADNQLGYTIDNTASATYSDRAGGTQQGPIQGSHATRVNEPDVSILKAGRNVTAGDAFGTISAPDAGDVLEYRVTLSNASGADVSSAFDVELRDAIPAEVRYDSMVGATLGGASLLPLEPGGAPDGPLSWGRSQGQDIDLPPGESLVLTYRVIVRDTLLAGASLVNAAQADWTSLDGASADERDGDGGSGGLDDYVSAEVFVSATAPDPVQLFKSAASGTLPGGEHRVGELATYTLTVSGIHEGLSPGALVRDTLPANMVFVETLSVHTDADGSPFDPAAPFTYTSLVAGSTAPAAGATGTIAWDFGDLTNAGDNAPDNDDLVIVYTARVVNTIDQANTTTLTNAATYDFDGAGGPAATRRASDDVTVLQPDLTISKELVSAPDPVLAGSVLRYRLVVENVGLAPAENVVVSDTLPEELRDTEPANFAYTIGGGAPGIPPVFDATQLSATGVVTWTWADGEPLDAGETMTIEYDVTVDGDVGPGVTIVNLARVVDYHSLDGSTPERLAERKSYGEEGPASAPALTTGTVSDMGKSGPADVAIGDTYEYVLTVPGTPLAVTLYEVEVSDQVPANVDVLDVRVEGDLQGTPQTPPFFTDNLVEVSIPAIDPDGQATVTITVRVLDSPDNSEIPPTLVTNQASFSYKDAPGGTVIDTIDSPEVETAIREPDLRMSKSGPAALDLGVAGGFTLSVANAGGASAWQARIVDDLPAEMRQRAPVVNSVSVGGDPLRVLSEASPDDYDVSWDGSAGRLTIQLKSSEARIESGETLSIDYDAQLDDNVDDGLDITNRAAVVEHFSQDTSAGTPPQTRTYAFDPDGGTPDDGDDPRADHTLTTRAPVLVARKNVDLREAEPGDTLAYSVTLTNTGTIDAVDASFADDLDASFEPGTLADLVASSGIASADPGGGANGTGSISVTGITIPAGASETISWTAQLRDVLPSGTVVLNQGTLDADGFDPIVTDSGAPEDDDGNESGNDPDDPNDDDPTQTIVESSPRVEAVKTVLDENGDTLEAGETLLYTIVVTNEGDEHAIELVLRDAIPPKTTYVAGSTTLNGDPVADVGGSSPLVSGLPIQAAGGDPGRLEVGQSVTVTFRVRVDDDVDAGTVISNQAFVNGEGEGSGPFEEEPSDDPDTSDDDDPTDIVVGNRPVVDATKTVVETGDAPLLPGDELIYTITIENSGVAEATSVVFVDPIPADSTYVPGSMTFDPDGPGSLPEVPLTDPADTDAGDFGVTQAGAITVDVGTIAADAEARITFRVTVDAGTAGGTIISNQGTVSSGGLPDEATDQDGNDENGDQPTDVVVGDLPALRATKQVFDLDGGEVEAGDGLEYAIVVTNIGVAVATNVVVTDPVPPPPTTYDAGTTTLNGVPQPDAPGGVSPLVAGLALGELDPGASATIRFRVTIPADTPGGTVIDNQATYAADGGLSGVTDSELDDGIEGGNDPDDPNDDDPTRVQIGGQPGQANVEGSVWLDTDHDRVEDGDEPGQPAWTVELLLNGVVIDSTTTDANGDYFFTGLPPGGGYGLRFRHPETGIVWGRPVSNAPGADTSGGIIENLTLPAGTTVIDQDLPLDPSGVVYDSIVRVAVPGAVVSLSGPAGFDPALNLLPGQQGQATGSDGYYRFDLVRGFPAGTYTLSVTPPTGFIQQWPSTILPPDAGPFDPTGLGDPLLVVPFETAPQEGEQVRYYETLDLAPGDPNVVNHHLPVDPFVDGAIQLRKTTPMSEVTRGGLVPYTIVARNTLSSTLTDIAVQDQLPPGFKYVAGSATIDGSPVEPLATGRQLTWGGLTFQPLETREIKLVLVVGAGVGEGIYVNQAWAEQEIADERLSAIARASVRVVADPTLDCSDVIGRVFLDRNVNGYPDEGEPGVAGVRLVTARGLLVTTDAEGRYHVTCAAVPNELRGSNFIMKLDTRTLPSGLRITSENPRVIRLTRGKMSTLDFGVSVHRVVRLEVSAAAFVDDGRAPGAALEAAFEPLVETLREGVSILRVAYLGSDVEKSFAKRAFGTVEERVRELWRAGDRPYTLTIEREHVELRGLGDAPGAWSFQPEKGDPADGAADRLPPQLFESDDAILRSAEPNTEHVAATRGSAGGAFSPAQPFRVVVDGTPGAETAPEPIDEQRAADLALERADIQVSFDGLNLERRLSVTTFPDGVRRGEVALFQTYLNYPIFVQRAEVRLFAPGERPSGSPLARVAVDETGRARWPVGEDAPDSIGYVLRVYDYKGRFDETAPRVLAVQDAEHTLSDEESPERELRAGYGESRLALRNIPLEGGVVTVSGAALPAASSVSVLERPVPVDPQGSFVYQEIVPAGRHNVRIEIVDPQGERIRHERVVYVPQDDWFFVGLADLTIGQTNLRGPAPIVQADEDLENDDVFVDGRIALYLKGKIKGEYLLTASIDTREEPLDEILSRIDEKDPRQLLRRLDPDRYYPVYGDDSTTLEDAPTQGRFYVRVERGDSHVLWGNFKTQLTETDLAQIDRGLYGAQIRYLSGQQTEFGERRFAVEGFAAEPETVQARDEFRGTGGSLYYLSHRDVTLGSERVRVEIRDKDSGLVLETRQLVANQDYDIDAVQGRLMLSEPLPSTSEDGLLVRDGSVTGHPVYIVARYEYAPLFGDIDDMAVGGRASGWVSESLQIGATGSRQETGTDTSELYGADATWRHSARTYVKVEAAQSEGPGLNATNSFDGGFLVQQGASAGVEGESAWAYRVEAAVDLADLGGKDGSGELRAYWQDQERGFSAPGQLSPRATELHGAALSSRLSERWKLQGKYDERSEEFGATQRALEANLGFAITKRWQASLGVRADDWEDDSPLSATIVAPSSPYAYTRRIGARTDVAWQLGYEHEDDWDVYGFLQGTARRDGTRRANNRYGLGAHWRLSDRLKLGAEASGGNGGLGGRVETDYRISDRTNVYLAYALDTDRSDTGLRGRNGTLTTGVRSRFSETLSVFGEERYLHGEGRSGLTHAFGADYAPVDHWKLGFTAEIGEIEDPLGGKMEREAATVSAGYHGDKLRAASAVEARRDEGSGAERETWLMRNTFSYQVDPDWRALAKLNLSISDSSQGEFYDGDFTEGVFGFAYRPVDDDRWNALFKYTFFEDLPSPDQRTRTNRRIDYSQRSHVLSADATVSLGRTFSLGGKYAFRIGELRPSRTEGEWFESKTQLVALRLDWHVVRNWDAFLEGRWLDVDLAGDTRQGALVGIYRHMGRNLKIGVGYNFSDFSDDLTDLDYDEEGWFLNLIGKF